MQPYLPQLGDCAAMTWAPVWSSAAAHGLGGGRGVGMPDTYIPGAAGDAVRYPGCCSAAGVPSCTRIFVHLLILLSLV
jgi:hypothetical protein